MIDKPCVVKKKPKSVKEFLLSSNFWKPALGVVIEGGLGFIYYFFIGCSSGKCAITSSPYMSIMYGSFIGFLLVKSPCKNC